MYHLVSSLFPIEAYLLKLLCIYIKGKNKNKQNNHMVSLWIIFEILN